MLYIKSTSLITILALMSLIFNAHADNKYTEPAFIKEPPKYPRAGIANELEGWVTVQTMIDKNGKAYETIIIKSGGSPLFREPVLRMVDKASFKPATLNGEPIDGSFRATYTFMMEGGTDGASNKFVRTYKKLRRALDKKQQQEASTFLEKLKQTKLKNLYEDAYLAIAKFLYLEQYGGTTSQLIAELEQATSHQSKAKYLPKSVFNAALQKLYTLQLETKDYGAALKTFELLTDNEGNETFIKQAQGTQKQILNIQNNDSTFFTEVTLQDSEVWETNLLKSGFALSNITGKITKIKLYCNKKFHQFEYQNDVEYQIPKSWGSCKLSLWGTPSTQLQLAQF